MIFEKKEGQEIWVNKGRMRLCKKRARMTFYVKKKHDKLIKKKDWIERKQRTEITTKQNADQTFSS